MPVYRVDPLRDTRWPGLLRRHPGATVFHAPGWLLALRRTYGYEPVVFTTSPPGEELANGWAFCRIHSWLTGRRLVSLPFSDHCRPLEDSSDALQEICSFLGKELQKNNWNYVETRPIRSLRGLRADFREFETFYWHTLDLHPGADEIFGRFNKDCVRRKIRRAEREGLTYEEGSNPSLLRKFYRLQMLTRKRHQLPPQPFAWFKNLADCMGEQFTLRVASKDGRPAAAIISLRFGDKVVYKYGGSDAELNRLGGMMLLFWKMIRDAKRDCAVELDLGRSDVENSGLIAFKEHWGAARSRLTYWRCPARVSWISAKGWKDRVAKNVLGHLPEGMLAVVGKVLYRHVG
jgi:CelD/BcsL family acetyltransferase involved in cellulose biosynthesis